MDTKSRKFSHSAFIKVITFLTVLVCFTGVLTVFVDVVILNNIDMDTTTNSSIDMSVVFEEDDYFLSRQIMRDSSRLVANFEVLLNEFKNEENILAGNLINESDRYDIEWELDQLFFEFSEKSKRYNPNLTHDENYQIFKEEYTAEINNKIVERNDRIIKNQLRSYNNILEFLNKQDGIVYYATDKMIDYTNINRIDTKSNNTSRTIVTNDGIITIMNENNDAKISKDDLQQYPFYIVYKDSKVTVYPEHVTNNSLYHLLTSYTYALGYDDEIYIAYTTDYLNEKMVNWNNAKSVMTSYLYLLIALIIGLIVSFIYLLIIIGRDSFTDKQVKLNFVDRIYNDINLILCGILIFSWLLIMSNAMHFRLAIGRHLIVIITFAIALAGLLLVLSLVKHLKNKTFIKHTLLYKIGHAVFYNLYKFIKDVYDSGSVAVKVLIVVIVYPILTAATLFLFPIVIAVAAWLAHKKVKEYNSIKLGVKRVKDGDIHHKIEINSDGEFKQLADDINSIADGLNKAIVNELKSERMKTELITNVSHDIRTPLTSIITYVDLLKQENDQQKIQEYIEIIEQKSERLKILTDDLFEAAKATSGNMPVNFEKIDIESLITQGLGELDDKIQEHNLDFKLNSPDDKLYIKADGKLLWRAVENLLSNIFKYALEDSRVYIDVVDTDSTVTITFKNISQYELNISPDELMERFARGDAARTSQGSGLGLSIAKSLIEIQHGSFRIDIDGDLFKAIIKMSKYK